MVHYKLNDEDEDFLKVPPGALVLASGVNGTEAWIERDMTTTVRIVVQSTAIATSDSATLEARIEVGDAVARAEDGPGLNEARLRAVQSVQVVVKAGERLVFKAYPKAINAHLMRTVVYTAELKPG